MIEPHHQKIVAELWPHLAALVATLDDLDGRTVTVAARPADVAVELRHRETMAAPIAP